ncbi:hypothetical protein N9349_05285 [Candidatus Pelagibacter sp.]|nr:hypothetical protein [Candidatus Pelagibacter sp.]
MALIKANNNTLQRISDQWRVTSAASFDDNGADITANLEQVDTTGQGTIGTAMTESSGIFSFPQTGIYKIDAQFSFYFNGNTRWIYALIKGTTDNSTYNNLSGNYDFIQQTNSSTTYTSIYITTLFDVTDTSNCKVKFHVDTQTGTTYYYADTNINMTSFSFTRLGDT